MPLWEKQLERYVRGLDRAELTRLLEQLLEVLDEAQYLAVASAVRQEGARRGLLAPRVGAGREVER